MLLAPALPTPAPRHGETLLRLLDVSQTVFFNATALPATAVPLGLGEASRLPVGVQVVARRGDDHLTIGVAMRLAELGAARWEPPPPCRGARGT